MTTGTEDPHGQDSERIARMIGLTRAGMIVEAALRAFWPLAAVLGVIWALLAFGLAEAVSHLQAWIVLGLAAGAIIWAGWRAFGSFVWPSRGDAMARIDATLPGRPLAAMADRPAGNGDDPAARTVWSAHMARMRARAAGARPVPADLRLAPRDPWALRLMALVVVLSAVAFARSQGVEGMGAALRGAEPAAVATGPSFEGWAEPPAYTGRPTLYLPEIGAGEVISVPEGTRVLLRVYGSSEEFALAETVSDDSVGLAASGEGIALAEFEVRRAGTVDLIRDGNPLAAWNFVAEPDRAPDITMMGPLERAPGGETRLSFAATDDYAVTGAHARITLDLERVDRRYGRAPDPEPQDPIVVDLPLPMTGAGTDIAETLVEDFSKHPWVGLPVTVTLTAEDAVGQTGMTEIAADSLPGRRFYDPLAAAVIEQRRDLLWSLENGRRVTQVLRAVTHRPEDTVGNAGAYLVLRTAIRRLDAAVKGDTLATDRDEIAEALWQAALILEEGGLGDAAERLARAKERLQEALRNGATDEEIAELMDELREATRDYMQQLAEEAIENGEMESAEAPSDGQMMSQDQIQQLMDRIQELSEQGRRAEAEALLEMLQQMLENMEMRMAEGQQGQGQGGQGQQSLQGMADALRQQQGLADESFQQLQREFQQGRQGGQPGQPGDPGGNQPGQPGAQQGQGRPGEPQQGEGQGGQSLAERQQELRDMVEQLRRDLPGAAGEGTREALREAERNMDEAGRGLEQGDTSGALDRQAEAIDNLRDGMRGLSEDMQRAEGDAQPGDGQDGQAQADGGRDPLGRPLGSRGSFGTDADMLPDGDPAARAREILDEIRRRSGELGRPEIELDYLRRLLDRF